MAPASKQTLIPMGLFMKNPRKSTLKAHAKIEEKNGIVKPPARQTKKKRSTEREQQRLKEEKEIFEGGEAWRLYMVAKGFAEVEQHNPSLLFQVYGPAPDPDLLDSSDEE